MSVSHNQLHAILVSIKSQMQSLKACNHSAIFSALEPNVSIHVRMVSADDITMSCSNQCGIGPIILTTRPPPSSPPPPPLSSHRLPGPPLPPPLALPKFKRKCFLHIQNFAGVAVSAILGGSPLGLPSLAHPPASPPQALLPSPLSRPSKIQ